MGIFSWKISEEDFESQVKNYSTLKMTESYRGISAILILGSMVITVLAAKFGLVDYDAIYSPILYLPIAFFIYKGKRWALVTIMVLWTVEKAYQLYDSAGQTSPILPIIWWSIFMSYFYNAYKIDLAIKKTKTIK